MNRSEGRVPRAPLFPVEEGFVKLRPPKRGSWNGLFPAQRELAIERLSGSFRRQIQQMKTAVVCGAGGFIGSHLVKRLKREGYWVRGVDIKVPEFAPSAADEFQVLDLRLEAACEAAVRVGGKPADEVYQLAADMGGMGFIHSAECEIMRNSALINIHMTHAAAGAGVPRYFFSSSVCVYRDMKPGEPEMTEAEAIPAHPDNEYGWEKLYSERVAQAYGRRCGMVVRIARFQNCYGPEGTWIGGNRHQHRQDRRAGTDGAGGTNQLQMARLRQRAGQDLKARKVNCQGSSPDLSFSLCLTF